MSIQGKSFEYSGLIEPRREILKQREKEAQRKIHLVSRMIKLFKKYGVKRA